MNASPILLQMKYARVIELYAEKYGISAEQAMDLFYKSLLYQEVREGISNLHCMSDDYLTEELHDEYLRKKEEE